MGRGPSQHIRTIAVVLSGTAGAGLGVLLGLVWLLAVDGETVEAIAVAALALVLGLAVAFQLILARAVAHLYEGLALRPAATDEANVERRVSAVEEELSTRDGGS